MHLKYKVFDSHFHIIDYHFPLVPNNSYIPPEFSCTDYLKRAAQLNIIGGAVVSGSFQRFDQTYLLAALKKLGPTFVGVTQLPITVSDDEIRKLHRAGVRALRFNIKRGGSESIKKLEYFAKRVHDIAGWHVELYVDSSDLGSLLTILLRLPAVSIDHLGLSKKGLHTLLHLAKHNVKIKATGFGRVDFSVFQALKAIASVNPDALLFGTDLPSTRARRPFLDKDINLIIDALGDPLAEKVLSLNAINFYRPLSQ
jgi:predicted TIM-barrel fold metal-dependent hydrolase